MKYENVLAATNSEVKYNEEVVASANINTKTSRADFVQAVDAFVKQASETIHDFPQYLGAVKTVNELVKLYAQKKNINIAFGKVVDDQLQPVGATVGIPTTHQVIIKALAELFRVKTEVAKEGRQARFALHGSENSVMLLMAIGRLALVIYDNLSRKYIDALTVSTAEKRAQRKVYTVSFASNTVVALRECAGLTEEAVSELVEKIQFQPEKPKKAVKKAAEQAENPEPAISGTEPEIIEPEPSEEPEPTAEELEQSAEDAKAYDEEQGGDKVVYQSEQGEDDFE